MSHKNEKAQKEVQIFYNDFFRLPKMRKHARGFLNKYDVAKRLTLAISCLLYESHGSIALDIGCGPGRLTDLLSTKFDLVVGIDFSAVAVRFAWQHCQSKGKCNFVLCDALNLPFKDKSIDVIVMSEILEHLYYQQQLYALQEAKRLLQPSGFFILTTPNLLYLDVKRLMYKIRHKPFPFSQIVENQLYPKDLLRIVNNFFAIEKKKGVFFSIPILDLYPIAMPLNNTILMTMRNRLSEMLENSRFNSNFFIFAQHQCLLCSSSPKSKERIRS